ncbi:MAG: C-GCAxxG-C-C family protein [Nitrospirae bacterium]|nr:C-GCAxxG-C-C family protein [Nitrospirota bacterium]
MEVGKLLEEKVSRRGLIKGMGKLVVGATGIAVVSGFGTKILGNAEAAKKMSSELPWPYKKFSSKDIKRAAEIAHANWFKGFCTFATLSGIVEMLKEKVGEPYKSLPLEAFIFAHGGTAGWGGTCGTLIGSGIAASLATGHKTGEQIANEVVDFYSETALPIYVPDHPKAELKAKSTSHSPVCHISVGKWMKAEGIAEGKGPEGVGFLSAQQMDRCARLSADVATRTIELLNDWADAKFKTAHTSPVMANKIPSQNNCTDCHGDKIPSPGPFGTGMDILTGKH